MPRTHGCAPKGERCFGISNWGARGRTNVIGALLGGVLLTVSLFSTTVNTSVFTNWLQQDLIDKWCIWITIATYPLISYK